jgi:hypothetical protein
VGDRPPPEGGPRPAGEATWLDESHAFIEQGLADLAERVDHFFGDDHRLDEDRPGSVVRWRNEFRTAEDRRFAYRTSARASVELPATLRWLGSARLVISGESQRDPTRTIAEDPANPGFSPVVTAEQASLELRQPLYRTADTLTDVGAGVRLRIPPEPYVRARLRHRQPLGLGVTLRLSPSVFWESLDGFGTASGLDLERPLGAHTLLRLGNHAQLTEVSKGVEWGSEASLAHEFASLRTATAVGAGISGDTRPTAEVLLYRIFTRVRRDVWRRWLFLELEPEIGWPLDRVRGGHHRVLAVTLRMDIQFEGKNQPEPAGALDARRGPP